MKKLVVKGLYGIEECNREVLSNIIKLASGKEKLAVVLYFMSEMKEESTIENISKNFKKILTDNDVKDYNSKYIRSWTSAETTAYKNNLIKQEDRLWINIDDKGIWINSNVGNQLALDFLAKNNIEVCKL